MRNAAGLDHVFHRRFFMQLPDDWRLAPPRRSQEKASQVTVEVNLQFECHSARRGAFGGQPSPTMPIRSFSDDNDGRATIASECVRHFREAVLLPGVVNSSWKAK